MDLQSAEPYAQTLGMGWLDRDYSRSNYEKRGGFDLAQLFFGSVSLGTWWDIHVRVHSSLVLLIVLNLLFAGARGGMGFKNALTSSIILFGIILLHEFGHCIAARRVGGYANEILLWPLGGLAFIHTPRRPWPTFVGTAGGPLANVLICVVTGAILLVMGRGHFSLPLNPYLPFAGSLILSEESYLLLYSNSLAYYLWWIYATSYMLFFFNMLPTFPLDGGHILQTILWPKFGYYNSMFFACSIGMAGAIIMGFLGLISGNLLLVFLAISGYLTCYQTRMTLRETADQAWEDSRAYNQGTSWPRKSRQRKLRRTPHDDTFSLRKLNPFEWLARWRRKRQFERLMKDD
ncbi:MAG: site-2 protease family protein [Armatimonadota bacterium]|nr:site-2 protease family protein [Armatimonadota bacterium]